MKKKTYLPVSKVFLKILYYKGNSIEEICQKIKFEKDLPLALKQKSEL
ncbi:MAG: hypothetical protein ACOC1O_03140 [bacterium]